MNQSNSQREPAGAAARDAAAGLVAGVLDRRQPLDALLDHDRAFAALEDRDRRLARAIASTALRRHGTVHALFDRLIERKPPRSRAFFHTLEIAATQILFMEVADHAAVSLAVDRIAADAKVRHLKGLANAVLRRLSREREALLASLDPSVDTPDWLLARWLAAYGAETAGAIAAAHRSEPPLDLSVKSDPDGWAEKLAGGVTATGSVRLADAGAIEALAGFADGAWWVQDMAAALPVRLLGAVAGKRVADLCAAPGGKTAELAAAGAAVTAVDISENRLKRLSANLGRLDLSAETVVADILDWQPPEPFDAVLLDAPCSATGTIRRHPDVAWLKAPEDIVRLAEVQARLIDRAAAMLKPGGTLVYCTCSLEPEEGEAQVAGAMARNGLALRPVTAAEIGGLEALLTVEGTIRTLPCHDAGPDVPAGMDGFFVMRLQRT